MFLCQKFRLYNYIIIITIKCTSLVATCTAVMEGK